MRCRHRPARRDHGLVRRLVLALAVCFVVVTGADAQSRRNNKQSAAQRAAMQKAREQMQAYQKDVMRFQKEMADKHAEIAKQFDENGDGQLKGAEKSKYDKHMFEIQKGRIANPFAGIVPPGQGPEMKAAKK